MQKRIITGIILIIFAIVLLFGLSPLMFLWATAIISLLAAAEWSALSFGAKKKPVLIIYLIITALVMWAVYKLPALPILTIAAVWWLIALALVLTYPRSLKVWSPPLLRALMGLVSIVPAWLAINIVREAMGVQVLLYMLALVWAADVGAYFTGKFWGRHLLLPQVSPKKTWEGCAGGLALAIVLSLIVAFIWQITGLGLLQFIFLTIVVVMISVLGDLNESMLKRFAGVKDSGNLLPGHGGILDRMDSVLAAAPIFLLGCILFSALPH